MPPLPYRTDAEALHRYVGARAAGRSAGEIRASGFATKQFEGTAAAVESLGLASDRAGALTPLGRRLAASAGSERAAIIAEVLWSYPPYAELLESAAGEHPPVTLREVETRWEAGGYGTSDSNRAEAAPVFARLVEAAGWGRFVAGRRGRGSRIDWLRDALRPVSRPSQADHAASGVVDSDRAEPRLVVEGRSDRGGPAPMQSSPAAPDAASRAVLGPADGTAAGVAATGGTRLRWELAAGRIVSLRLPEQLTSAERARVRALLDLLLQE